MSLVPILTARVPATPLVWAATGLFFAGLIYVMTFVPAYWRGTGWRARRAEVAMSVTQRGGGDKSLAHMRALVPLLIAILGLVGVGGSMAIWQMTRIDGWGRAGFAFAGIAVLGFLLEWTVANYNGPKFLVPPRMWNEPGLREVRRMRRQGIDVESTVQFDRGAPDDQSFYPPRKKRPKGGSKRRG